MPCVLHAYMVYMYMPTHSNLLSDALATASREDGIFNSSDFLVWSCCTRNSRRVVFSWPLKSTSLGKEIVQVTKCKNKFTDIPLEDIPTWIHMHCPLLFQHLGSSQWPVHIAEPPQTLLTDPVPDKQTRPNPMSSKTNMSDTALFEFF